DLPVVPSYVPPSDRESLDRLIAEIEAQGFIDHKLNLGLLPEPFIGNPNSATVLLLSVNPGDAPGDKKAHEDPAFREAILCNLRHGTQDHPFYPLYPPLRWTACADWWTRHVRWLLEHPDLDRRCIAERL